MNSEKHIYKANNFKEYVKKKYKMFPIETTHIFNLFKKKTDIFNIFFWEVELFQVNYIHIKTKSSILKLSINEIKYIYIKKFVVVTGNPFALV